jgi:hypothetical protein
LHHFPKRFTFTVMPELIKPHHLVADLNDRAFRAGVKMADVLRHAKMPQSTWLRWVHGRGHTPVLLDKLNDALTEIIEKDNANG